MPCQAFPKNQPPKNPISGPYKTEDDCKKQSACNPKLGACCIKGTFCESWDSAVSEGDAVAQCLNNPVIDVTFFGGIWTATCCTPTGEFSCNSNVTEDCCRGIFSTWHADMKCKPDIDTTGSSGACDTQLDPI